jgi:uncharacterized protein (TIGR02147 family)
MPNIFSYFDYRRYLRDFYEEQKKESLFFSYRFIGNKVGMDSSFVIKVLQGQLHISAQKIPDFTKICNFDEKKAAYFEALVYFNKAKTEKESKLYFEKLLSINNVPSDKITGEQYKFFTKWYYSAVWCLLNFYKCNRNFRELGEQLDPCITAKQAKESIRLLDTLGLIVMGDDGFYQVTSLNLTTGQEWHSLAIAQYQLEMLKLAQESLERFEKNERDISTLTMNISTEALKEIREVTNEYRDSLKKIANRYKDANRVYQLNIQLFPLTRIERKQQS